MDTLDLAFTVIYTVEALIKILAYGFVMHRKSYLRDLWNVFDFIIVLASWISMIPNVPNLKSLRTLRVMRPLRTIEAIPSMRRLVNSFLLSLPQIFNVVIFFMFMFLIFGILGIQAFQGM